MEDEPIGGADTTAALGELYLTLTHAPHEARVDATPDCRGENDSTGLTSVKLARVWVGLEETKAGIDNEIVPLGMHLGLDDPELMIALETLSEKIREHFDSFKLVAEPRR